MSVTPLEQRGSIPRRGLRYQHMAASDRQSERRLTREERRQLRELGWRTRRKKAKRPPRINRRDVLVFDEDVRGLVEIEEAQ